jgi:hypothetical protein
MEQPRSPLAALQSSRFEIIREINCRAGRGAAELNYLRSDTNSVAWREVVTDTLIDAVTLAALADFPRRLEAYYDIVPAEHKNWRPSSWQGVPSEPFTPIEQICHVRDIEIDGYHVRFRRALQEENPLLASVDGERLALDRNYADADVAQVFSEFARARRESLALIAKLSPQDLSRAAEFEGNAVTVRGLVHNLCSHDQQHLAGLQWLLARLAAPAAKS